jgi:quercetin dioxygenase-like cupin family protein
VKGFLLNQQPYIIYPSGGQQVEAGQLNEVVVTRYIDEPGQVSFGTIDYVPGWHIALHHHNTWELIIIDGSSAGPGYTFFDGRWWRADPGSGVFVPRGYPHAWSCGNSKGFKMLWVYGDSATKAGRAYDTDPDSFRAITEEQEDGAGIWVA